MSGELHGVGRALGEALGDLFGAPAPTRADPLLRPAIIALIFTGGAFCGAAAVVAAYVIGLLQGNG